MTAIIIVLLGFTALFVFNSIVEHKEHKRIEKELDFIKTHLNRILTKEAYNEQK